MGIRYLAYSPRCILRCAPFRIRLARGAASRHKQLMPALFLSLLACLLLTLAGREQVRVARLSAALGPGTALLVAIWQIGRAHV